MPTMNTLLSTAFEPVSPATVRTERNALCEFGFVLFLLLIFVTLKPFAIRDVAVLPPGDSGSGEANVWRQVCYLGAFALIALSAWRSLGARMIQAVPAVLAVLLAWCLATALWAQTPEIAMRRAGLEIVIALSAMFGLHSVGSERAMTLLRHVLGAVLVVNFASIALVDRKSVV